MTRCMFSFSSQKKINRQSHGVYRVPNQLPTRLSWRQRAEARVPPGRTHERSMSILSSFLSQSWSQLSTHRMHSFNITLKYRPIRFLLLHCTPRHDPPVMPRNIHSQHRWRTHIVACIKANLTDGNTNFIGAGVFGVGGIVIREANGMNEQTGSCKHCVQFA